MNDRRLYLIGQALSGMMTTGNDISAFECVESADRVLKEFRNTCEHYWVMSVFKEGMRFDECTKCGAFKSA